MTSGRWPWTRLRRKIRLLEQLNRLDQLDQLLEAIGRIEARQVDAIPSRALEDREFTVFSQAGEDGIIHHLVRTVRPGRKVFVEFGVENYRQANTRFLALNDGWSGLVMDSDALSVQQIRSDPIYWRCNIKAVHAFATRENINDLLTEHGVTGEIGLLSIDIDGNDYWVWDAVDVVQPAIVVIEYNFRFGPDRSVTIPYDPAFDRRAAHPSRIYFGASLRALTGLGERKGYAFVGCNRFGVNAFFVRGDLLPDGVKRRTVHEGYVAGQVREATDETGRLLYLTRVEEDAILDSLPVVTVG
jgi:hypothetical protein